MQSLDHNVLKAAADWLDAGHHPWLCTIVKTVGSSPRPVGSMLCVLATGEQVGTVSGGCVEEELLEKLRAGELAADGPERLEYGVSAAENERLGLPCGGRLELLLQRLDSSDREWIQLALAAIADRQCIERQLDLASGKSQMRPVPRFGVLALGDNTLRQCFGPSMRLLLVGAGQLAQSLAELAQAMDYEVLVTDPRQDTLDQWEGPSVELIQGMPDDVVRQRARDPHSVIITLTHDPRIDDMALMEALTTPAWYVGALGSVRTTEKRLQRLRQLGLSETELARLHAPVGLPIGSKTPLEIAVAIMAELTQLRRQPTAP